ncbi:MAG TPA: ATP-binding cassette domain-containing protein [Puia sp.]|nr:ATP-binding cassette domain-containing protein [Puia sp.]
MVDIQDLHFRYRRKPVFAGLSLQLLSGHVYGLLGKNGTGKSTLLRSMAGLLQPEKGKISVFDFIPFERNPDFLARVFMVPEEFYLPDITVSRYLDSNLHFYPDFNESKMSGYLKEFDVPAAGTLQQMSYGQKKKVLISFALASDTPLLLLDEPTNGLDIMSKSQFRKVIASAMSENKTVVISTHQVKDIENLVDRILIIEDGRILFDQGLDMINKKLTCTLSYEPNAIASAFYAEASIHGTSIITANPGEDEGSLDLEMLYKAIVTNGDRVSELFKSNTINSLP